MSLENEGLAISDCDDHIDSDIDVQNGDANIAGCTWKYLDYGFFLLTTYTQYRKQQDKLVHLEVKLRTY